MASFLGLDSITISIGSIVFSAGMVVTTVMFLKAVVLKLINSVSDLNKTIAGLTTTVEVNNSVTKAFMENQTRINDDLTRKIDKLETMILEKLKESRKK